jgi:hypothetical protein
MTQDDVRIHINPEVLFSKEFDDTQRPCLHGHVIRADKFFMFPDYDDMREELLVLGLDIHKHREDPRDDLDEPKAAVLPYWEWDEVDY